jgi:hypothetical protein
VEVRHEMKNTLVKSVLAVILGTTIGIFSKWGDIIPGDNMIKYFGWISSGILLWLVIGSFLIIKSKNRTEFSVLYSLFMISMLISYYIFSIVVVQYLNARIVLFWLVMFVGSLILGNVVFSKRYTKLFRWLFIFASVFFLLFDAIKINGISLQAVIPELLLSLSVLIIMNKSSKNTNK